MKKALLIDAPHAPADAILAPDPSWRTPFQRGKSTRQLRREIDRQMRAEKRQMERYAQRKLLKRKGNSR